MKKLLIASAIASVFAAPAFAAVNPNTDADHTFTYEEIEKSGYKIMRDGDKHVLVDADNKFVADVDAHGHKGDFTFTNKDGEIKYNARTGEGTVETSGSKETFKLVDIKDLPDINDEKRPNHRDNDQNNHDDGRFDSVAEAVMEQIEAGNKVVIGEHEISRSNIDEVTEIVNNMSDEQKKAVFDHVINSDVKVEEDALQPRPDDNKTDDEKNRIETERNKAKIDAIVDAGGKAAVELEKAAAGAYKEAATAYNNLDNKINANSARIDSLEQDMVKMGNKMLDLEDRMDGVVATSHAITNARPMVQSAGEFAIGAGIGAAGSKQALAIGGAYQFNESWSGSTTINYETAGKRSTSQFSAGAGVQYKFK